MNTTIKSSNDITEMLFEKRNKDYGAYAIRTAYNDSVIKSLLLVSGILLLFVTSTYAYNNFFSEKVVMPEKNPDITYTNTIVDISPLEEKKIAEEKPAYREATKAMATVVSDKPEIEPDPKAKTGAITATEIKGDSTVAVVPGVGPTVGGGLVTKAPEVETTEIIAEVMPEYPGGNEALMGFLSNNIVYPEKAVAMGVEGTVYVSFVVNKEGKVEGIKILKGIGADCNEEAMRVVAKMPKWKPGKNAGKEVRVMFNLPIRFRLN